MLAVIPKSTASMLQYEYDMWCHRFFLIRWWPLLRLNTHPPPLPSYPPGWGILVVPFTSLKHYHLQWFIFLLLHSLSPTSSKDICPSLYFCFHVVFPQLYLKPPLVSTCRLFYFTNTLLHHSNTMRKLDWMIRDSVWLKTKPILKTHLKPYSFKHDLEHLTYYFLRFVNSPGAPLLC